MNKKKQKQRKQGNNIREWKGNKKKQNTQRLRRQKNDRTAKRGKHNTHARISPRS